MKEQWKSTGRPCQSSMQKEHGRPIQVVERLMIVPAGRGVQPSSLTRRDAVFLSTVIARHVDEATLQSSRCGHSCSCCGSLITRHCVDARALRGWPWRCDKRCRCGCDSVVGHSPWTTGYHLMRSQQSTRMIPEIHKQPADAAAVLSLDGLFSLSLRQLAAF